MKRTLDERKADAREDLEGIIFSDGPGPVCAWLNKHRRLIDQLLKPRFNFPSSHKFKRWDRVRLSAEGKRQLQHIRAKSRHPNEEFGTVVTTPRYSEKVSVRVDGYKFYSVYHIDFWEKA